MSWQVVDREERGVDRLDHVGGAGEPVRGLLDERAFDERDELGRAPRRVGRDLIEARRWHLDVHAEYDLRVLVAKRQGAGQHLEQDDADRVEVGARVGEAAEGWL